MKKKFKWAIVFITSISMALSLVYIIDLLAQAQPVGEPMYSIDSGILTKAGEKIVVPINVANNPRFAAVGFLVSYDADVLEINDIKAPIEEMPLNSQFKLTETPGTQWIHLINTNATDWSGDGKFVYITFNVKPNAVAGVSRITLEFTEKPDGTPANASGDILSNAITVSGSIRVKN